MSVENVFVRGLLFPSAHRAQEDALLLRTASGSVDRYAQNKKKIRVAEQYLRHTVKHMETEIIFKMHINWEEMEGVPLSAHLKLQHTVQAQ